jgi:hypothetical protein
VELGFASGIGAGGNKSDQRALQNRLENAKQKLFSLRNSKIANEMFEAAKSEGLLPRSKWLGTLDAPPMSSLNQWIEHAASPNGNGAAMSTFWTRKQVEELGSNFPDRLLSIMKIFGPLIDAIYVEDLENDLNEEEGKDDSKGKERPYSLSDIILDGCFLDLSELKEIHDQLRSKRNLILQGPPGTGKTWLAKRLGYALIGFKSRRRIRVIQFHPSLSYEDFVRGWRTHTAGTLELVDGIFLQAIQAARYDKAPFVLIIEEINRGNPAQVFGEMLTLLENTKRGPDESCGTRLSAAWRGTNLHSG